MKFYRTGKQTRVRNYYIGGIAAVLICLAQSSVHGADKVIVSYSSRSYAFLPAQVAMPRGFFKDENL